MKYRDLLANWGLSELTINMWFAEAKFEADDHDRNAAWELYVEMLTRIVTQPLPDDAGDEKAALGSIYELFPLTRDILKKYSHKCQNFTKIAVVALNHIVRPFTAKWHKRSLSGNLNTDAEREEFRGELRVLQTKLVAFAQSLAKIAEVEDMTQLAFDITVDGDRS